MFDKIVHFPGMERSDDSHYFQNKQASHYDNFDELVNIFCTLSAEG